MKNRNVVIGCAIVFFTFFLFIVFVAVVSQMFVRGKTERTSVDLMEKWSGGGKDKIGIIYISGIIRTGGEQVSLFAESEAGSDAIVRALEKGRRAKRIKAIVVRVNSPGGSAAASQEIYNEIIKVKREKPVIISMGSVAASGGYYVAAAADTIFADPATLTGSIGVIMQYLNLEGSMEKIGASPVTITSGEHKDLGSPFRPLSDEERKILQDAIDNIYVQFVRDVASGRRMTEDEVAALADGRFYTGEQALENKLIDRLGGYQDALEYAAKKVHLPSPPDVEHLQRTIPLFYFTSLSRAFGLDILKRQDLNSLADYLLLSPYSGVQ